MAIYKETNINKIPKDGRCYYFRIYKNGKQFQSKYYSSRAEAKNEEAIFILKRDLPSNKPFSLIADSYFKELYTIRKESTYYTYLNCYTNNIKPYFENYNISKINVNIINNWKETLQNSNLKTAYLNKIFNVLNCIFIHAVNKFSLDSNPMASITRFQSRNDEVIKDEEKLRYITFEDFNKFIAVINNLLWKTFFIFLYYTGMRKGEVQALTWNDIDFVTNEITVNKTLTVKSKDSFKITSTKNCINRKIKISSTLREQLLAYKNDVMKYTDFNNNWFVFGNSRFIPQTTIDRYKHKYFAMSGVKEITIHEFRHSHISLLINQYLKSGQTDSTKFFLMMGNRMGHSIEVMQRTYMHLFPTIQDEIVDMLNNL